MGRTQAIVAERSSGDGMGEYANRNTVQEASQTAIGIDIGGGHGNIAMRQPWLRTNFVNFRHERPPTTTLRLWEGFAAASWLGSIGPARG